MAAWILELKMGSSNNCSLGFNKKPSSNRCNAAFAAAAVLSAVPVADATAAESAEAAPEILGSGQATFGPKGRHLAGIKQKNSDWRCGLHMWEIWHVAFFPSGYSTIMCHLVLIVFGMWLGFNIMHSLISVGQCEGLLVHYAHIGTLFLEPYRTYSRRWVPKNFCHVLLWLAEGGIPIVDYILYIIYTYILYYIYIYTYKWSKRIIIQPHSVLAQPINHQGPIVAWCFFATGRKSWRRCQL